MTPKECIKAFCIQCFGGGRGGRTDIVTIGKEIIECTDTNCPLYQKRPLRGFRTLNLSDVERAALAQRFKGKGKAKKSNPGPPSGGNRAGRSTTIRPKG